MKYLLDQEEYNALKNSGKRELQALKDKLSSVAISLAEHRPVDIHGDSWEPKKVTSNRPHGCIHSDKLRAWYCSEDCPSVSFCNQTKSWSK